MEVSKGVNNDLGGESADKSVSQLGSETYSEEEPN